jgi:hypothetical protein
MIESKELKLKIKDQRSKIKDQRSKIKDQGLLIASVPLRKGLRQQ